MMTSEPTTHRETVARIIDRYATWGSGSFCYSVDEEVDRRNRALAKADAILSLFPDSPALTALKLAAVEYSKTDLRDDWGKFCDAEADLGNAARAFAKEQREGSDV